MFGFYYSQELNMEQDKYIQPDSCEMNRSYYVKTNGRGSGASYQKVRFLSYRPHPAEVLIHDGEKARVIHRCILYEKGSNNGGCK